MTLQELLPAACFWFCFAVVCYVYLGYPIVISALAWWLGRRAEAPPIECDEELPTLSLLIAAFNEERVIEDRIRNALALDYPGYKLEIIVASDGSSDGTAAIVRRYQADGVRLLDCHPRRGKTAALGSASEEVRGEIVMLSDANTHWDAGAAHALARWFRDPSVGVVCGRLVLSDPATGRNVDSLYWRYETFLKQCEGRLGALLGVNGAIYAIRRSLLQLIPEGAIVDDLVLPLRCRLETGCALVYDRAAVAREESAPSMASEFHRRARFGAGGFQAIGMLWRLLDPRQGWVALTFFSHKVLRWLGPFALFGMAASNLFLVNHSFYLGLLIGQAAFYGIALASALVPGRSRAVRLLRLTTLFAAMNLAILFGFYRWARGSQRGAWRRTARAAESVTPCRPPAASNCSPTNGASEVRPSACTTLSS
jgi:cellulose synthase/poly-beta-1,6-N-acetylglucosamine synthase-like glycosyltransferase